MLTPLEIESKEFKKTPMGYNTKDVDSFIEKILRNYEEIYKENIELKDKIGVLGSQLRQYSDIEETLNKTLLMAQTTASELTESSKKKAEVIIQDADLKARNIVADAMDKSRELELEYEGLKTEVREYKSRIKTLIKAQLASLEDLDAREDIEV